MSESLAQLPSWLRYALEFPQLNDTSSELSEAFAQELCDELNRQRVAARKAGVPYSITLDESAVAALELLLSHVGDEAMRKRQEHAARMILECLLK